VVMKDAFIHKGLITCNTVELARSFFVINIFFNVTL